MSDDLISRQDAIDALGEEPEVWLENDDYELGLNNQWHYDVNALKAVPPAQRWIPVSDRLPEKYIGQWLCCTSDGEIMVLPYDTPGDGTKECVFYQWDDDGYFYQTFDVVAWMPLPKPYNEELKLR